jgi:hypothetical protein
VREIKLPVQNRHRLGAEELIELGSDGRAKKSLGHQPFLATRLKRSPFLGQARPEISAILSSLENVATFLAQDFATVLGAVRTVAGIPLVAIAANAELVANVVVDLLSDVPALRGLVAQALLLGGTFQKFGLVMPDLPSDALGNLQAGMALAFGSTSDGQGLQAALDEARTKIVDRAPNAQKSDLKEVLDASGVSGGTLTPAPLAAPAA